MISISPVILGACSTVGTTSIDWGRTPYNQAIHNTAEQQTLLNIVRVASNESPFFMDVSEVDAATTVGASISGGPSQLGATPNYKSTSAGTIDGTISFITGGATYQEAPTVRYLPLLGQPLIAQVSTPLSAEALTDLYNSDWSLPAILQLGVDRLTPGYLDYAAAVNAITALDLYGAIIIGATQSPKKKDSNPNYMTIAYNQQPTKPDNLTIYYQPDHVLDFRAYCEDGVPDKAKDITDALWKRLKTFFDENFNPHDPNWAHKPGSYAITIRGKPQEPPDSTESKAPLLRTRSALGIMKAATFTGLGVGQIQIDSPESVRELINKRSNLLDDRKAQQKEGNDYLNEGNRLWKEGRELNLRGETAQGNKLQARGKQLLIEGRKLSGQGACHGDDFYIVGEQPPKITRYPKEPRLTMDQIKDENALLLSRRYMLIAKSEYLPNGAFASVRDGGYYYYIFNDDEISKKTLALIAQFNTILAVPSSSAPLTPTISVGARM
jgi:hypothetical protein